ncbi:T9SS type A sorting domain-containing protein [Hymenobacter volaticus]|uniref:T9SS type A sorting domain-containing protein n=1 Tax=Hymenobacter volaticus TaxID=2932254 RepID=A0ABY4GEP1_9BACT|nr:T9SS type A sorting domain-containing protein [Hymenobacter volaticus]UOQ69396.1 T9SS type A sorting domain-containing protein [Hymenobacter volaticus]
MTTFQGKTYPTPASATGKRIVVAYGSNPLTNGNGVRASTGVGSNQGGTPGNHTPQDIWVGAEDNTNSSHAARISGQGLLDNTALTSIMANFMSLSMFEQVLAARGAQNPADPTVHVFPTPFNNQLTVSFDVTTAAPVSVELFNELGQKVATLVDHKLYRAGSFTVPVDAQHLGSGLYIATVTIDGQVISKKTVKL